MNVDVAYYSSIGGRALNEDSVSVLESGDRMLTLVADGLGGHGGGDAASQCTTATVGRELHNKPLSEELLFDSIGKANREILAMQNSATQMKSTIAALWISGSKALAANVGDTRIYQFRQGRIIFQSVDHSVAQMAVLVGAITYDEIRGSKDRNRLVRALGTEGDVKPDINELSVLKGDCFLLCTDGFWELVTENEMLKSLVYSESMKDWLSDMRKIILGHSRKNMDNNTAAVLQIL